MTICMISQVNTNNVMFEYPCQMDGWTLDNTSKWYYVLFLYTTKCKALFTQHYNFTMTMINGAKERNHAQLGLQSLSLCHVVVLQSWLIAWLQEVVNQSSCTSHALAEHSASARNPVLHNKPTHHLKVTLWSLLIFRMICLSPPPQKKP